MKPSGTRRLRQGRSPQATHAQKTTSLRAQRGNPVSNVARSAHILPVHCRTLWSGSNPWTCTEQKIPTDLTVGIFYSGAPRRIRTLNLLIRSQMLYPIEPWAQRSYILYIFITIARKNNSFFIGCRDRGHLSHGTAC